ncbi:hypothetical protein [Mangrovibacterium sp.]|uniref:golvesin C-terminal-like domain-containing protein n=1 Tax=Mangrovibacterium sp. TaxID=1961364 RepID=UPI003569A79B
MISLHNIRSIALYETKTLLRSWFFRIFAILAMVVLIFFNVGTLLQAGGTGMWAMKGIPANIPYVNLLLLNVVQAIIAIFLASDFLKRDKKLDTTEVIYVRPMTNGEYVIGKTLGNLGVFIVLNLIILGIALVFNFIAKDTEPNYLVYLYYFLLISVPTLMYIMGLSFLLMSLIKNQAVTFVVLLGYVAIALFYLKDKFYYLFDYMAFNIPMAYSDFVGFGNVQTLLVHRGMYFFLGLSFILYTIIMLKRLPHSNAVRYIASILGTICLVFGVFLGYKHVNQFLQEQNLRAEMIAINENYRDTKAVQVSDYDIQLQHEGDQIKVAAKLTIGNTQAKPIKEVIFSLNPGLKLDDLTANGQPQRFEQTQGLIKLTDFQIQPGENAALEFRYSGFINEAATYLDIDEETRGEAFRNFLYQIDKRYAFLTEDYVLLTRENGWYPVPGAGYSPNNSQWFARQFSNYKLSVTTTDGLTAISQGKAEQDGNTFRFESTHANSQISLVIGDYERIEQDIDGLSFNIYVKKGHDYFSSFFEDIKDTIPAVVTEALQDFERSLDMYYPFEQFSIVETPIQFCSYDRVLTGSREQTQPEMVLFAEKGLLVNDADFAGRMENQGRFGSRDRNEDMTPEEKKIQVLKNFISSFTSKSGRPNFSRSQGQMQVEEQPNIYYIFPLFYNYAYYISSDRWPITDRVFEGYKKGQLNNSTMGWMRDLQGMSENEEANLALLSHSFEDLLEDPDQKQIIDNVIQLKGTALFSIIKRQAGDEAFEDFLFDYLSKAKFANASIEDFNRQAKNEFDIDLIPYMENWFASTDLPAFLIGPISAVNVLDVDQLKTMVKFKVSNTENTEGILLVEFRTGGGFGRSSSSSDNVSKLIHLDGNQTKEVSFLLSGTPRGATINTLVSRNIPSEIQLRLDNIEEDPKAIPFEGEEVVDSPVRIAEDNEIILDNEDPGFEISASQQVSLLRQLLIDDDATTDKYQGFNGWRAPRTWTLTTNSSFYGAYIRSAYYIRSGEGDQVARWNIPITDAGFYDVYAFVYKEGQRRRNRNPGEFHYTIHHDDGSEKAVVEVKSADEGWNHLGAFYFSRDTALVELSNLNTGSVVVADAIKLIKQ